jgi:hypothetical protein
LTDYALLSRIANNNYLGELPKDLRKFRLLHIIVVEVVHNGGDKGKVQQLQQQNTQLVVSRAAAPTNRSYLSKFTIKGTVHVNAEPKDQDIGKSI